MRRCDEVVQNCQSQEHLYRISKTLCRNARLVPNSALSQVSWTSPAVNLQLFKVESFSPPHHLSGNASMLQVLGQTHRGLDRSVWTRPDKDDLQLVRVNIPHVLLDLVQEIVLTLSGRYDTVRLRYRQDRCLHSPSGSLEVWKMLVEGRWKTSRRPLGPWNASRRFSHLKAPGFFCAYNVEVVQQQLPICEFADAVKTILAP